MSINFPVCETSQEEKQNPFYEEYGNVPIVLKSVEEGSPFSQNLPFLKELLPGIIKSVPGERDSVAIRLKDLQTQMVGNGSECIFSEDEKPFGMDSDVRYHLEIRRGVGDDQKDEEPFKGVVLSSSNNLVEVSDLEGWGEIEYPGINLKIAFPFRRNWVKKESDKVGELPRINGKILSSNMKESLDVEFILLSNNYRTNIGFFLVDDENPEILKFLKDITHIPNPRYLRFISKLKFGFDRTGYTYYNLEIGV
jgi:hypothetical protein